MTTLFHRLFIGAVGALALMVLGGVSGLVAQTTPLASGDVTLDMKHRTIALEVGDQTADVEVLLINNTANRQEFKIELTGVPTGWDVDLWDQLFDYKVGSVALKGEETLELRLLVGTPAGLTEDQTHLMTIRLVGLDGRTIDSAGFSVRALPPKPKEAGNVVVTSTYPVLRGAVGNVFEFELDIRNRTGANASFNLSAAAPTDWFVEFIPAFGESKRITSVSMVDNGNQRVKVSVAPPGSTAAAEYSIIVTVGNDQTNSETTLLLTLTGKGIATVSTGSGRLNIAATAGEPAPLVFRIGNTGTAELRNLVLTAVAPDDWGVQFQLSPVPFLPANNIIDIQTLVIPSPGALPGDYLVKLRANSPDTDASLDIRVTVGQSTIWGWVGIGIVVLVLAGLGGLFVRLGRR